MVSITVILAAVIATFVFGMAGSIPVSRSVVYTVSQSTADEIIVVYQGGPDAEFVEFSRIVITPSDGSIGSFRNSTGSGLSHNIVGNRIGDTVTATSLNPNGFTGKDHVIVTAMFRDGSSQVVLNAIV